MPLEVRIVQFNVGSGESVSFTGESDAPPVSAGKHKRRRVFILSSSSSDGDEECLPVPPDHGEFTHGLNLS